MATDRILFVCTDGARSQMAAAILNEHASDRFLGSCAATNPKPVDPRTIQSLRQHGIDAGKVVPCPLPDVRGWYRFAISLDEAVPLPNWVGTRALAWPLPDPLATDSLAAFEQSRDLIEATLFDWLTKFEESEPLDEPSVPRHHLEQQAERTRDF